MHWLTCTLVFHRHTGEIYAGVGWGPLTFKYSHTVTKGYFGTGKQRLTAAVQATSTWPMPRSDAQVTFKAAIGHTTSSRPSTLPAHLTSPLQRRRRLRSGQRFSLAGAFVGATRKDNAAFNYTVGTETRSLNKRAFIVSITKAM